MRRIAASLGYTPDPAVQALVAYRNRLSRKSAGAAIAFVTNGESEYGWRMSPTSQSCFAGAQERAASLGYRLDHFWAGESGLGQRRLNQILFHRGITGVLLFSEDRTPQNWLDLEWDRLSGIAIGAQRINPVVHRVTTDYAGNARLAFRRARDAGYRRIGVILPEACDEECDGAWASPLAAEQHAVTSADAVPHFVLRGGNSSGAGDALPEIEAEHLAQWIKRFRPEVIVGWSRWVRPFLAIIDVTIPGDIAFIDMDRDGSGPGCAGIRENHHAVGSVAIELVVHHMHQNVRGVPAIPTRTLVEGIWCDGASMPRLHGSFASCHGRASAGAWEASIA